MRYDFTVTADSVHVSTGVDRNRVVIDVDQADIEPLLNDIDLTDLIRHYGADALLKEIGLADIVHNCSVDDLLETIGLDAIHEFLSHV